VCVGMCVCMCLLRKASRELLDSLIEGKERPAHYKINALSAFCASMKAEPHETALHNCKSIEVKITVVHEHCVRIGR